MKRFLVPLCGALAALALTAGSAFAIIPGTLDQEQAVTTADVAAPSTVNLAQTFTAGVSGNLLAVGVNVGVVAAPAVVPAAAATPPPGSNFALDLVPTSSGLPSFPPLAPTMYGTLGASSGWVYFVLATPVAITSGRQYAIVVRTLGSGLVHWAGDCTNAYAGGQSFADDRSGSAGWVDVASWNDGFCMQDFAIRTYVTTSTPPPTTATPAAVTSSNSSSLPIFAVVVSLTAAAAFVIRRRIEQPHR